MIVPHRIEGTIPVLATIICTGHRHVHDAHSQSLRLDNIFRVVWGPPMPERLVVTGGAMGWDILCAEQAQGGTSCTSLIARPFAGHDEGWPAPWRARFRATWERADIRVTVCAIPGRSAYHPRNRYMLQLLEAAPDGYVLAYWDGQQREGSGTWATIRQALKLGLTVANWHPDMPPRVEGWVADPPFAQGRLFS